MTREIYKNLKKLAKDENKARSKREPFWTITNIWYFASIGSIVLAFLLTGINFLLDYKIELLVTISFIAVILGYLGLLLTPVVGFIANFRGIKQFFESPVDILINNAETKHELDELVYKAFLDVSLDDLKLAKLEMVAEHKAFTERRTSTVGQVEKLGLIPGLIALALMIPKIERLEYEWLMTLVYANAALIIFGVFATYQATKMERYISIIDLAIEKLEEKN
ncbi:hypothetical protein DXX93_10395 [Thalassotalea euphylliae]|uniref:Uncharacterized protein n=1 Tax=Thalassotalea euphylliae TaxID=1655234 RepID=A0A3E0TR25_9GAMM|nr:hypothetical protein [Thalassotalea euphylliae]REL26938.1 hypothetical protein DXX93_10395 [Thalassotalea euphylliae]